ncbi:MAG: hypothetical protein LKJ99_06190 [Acidaminococcaceae bacterium]|nr:hypothetical protein [Acidaminococcaceae bacterium]MCI2110544.1 hypothetical protein [Acidaminococcaceae bacterium]
METNFLRKHKPLLIFGAILLIGALVFSNKKIDIKNSLTKQTSFPSHSVNLGKNVLNLQRLRIPSITTYSQDKILNFFIQNRTYYIALRSGDNNSSSLYAFDRKDNALLTQKNFGENGVMTFKTKMLLSITRGIDGEIYYIRHGVHALKNGNDVVSYKDKTTATKIALLPGEHQAYLYGNDNFTLADIKDNAFENKHGGFLDNRAAPFHGGLTLVQINNDGSIYGGGRIVPNGPNQIAGFTKAGKLIKKYGGVKQTAKDSISNLIDMTILKNYICVIDGFNIKIWRKDGTYLGHLDNVELLGENFSSYKLAPLDDNTLGILAYQRSGKTKLMDIAIFSLTLPVK